MLKTNNVIFHTRNARYDVDLVNKRIKRTAEINDPVNTYMENDAWISYQDISVIKVGQSVHIVWDLTTLKTTITSTVTSVIESR